MTSPTQTLDELYNQRKTIKELLRWAKIYGGRVRLGNEVITSAELKEQLNNVKINIALEISHRKLRLIK